ncbi:hypothetical protein [Methylicorpusculum sp.]|uniref:hypothetical protein n=1 Tax=Methylicorpusculum sp. TaxID=2713644 RepID=UPI002ABA951D|nr:hypothetical protein [Methylicorpusculum sp.]MDZ4154676.1 hypothetical protein [Methylicorpusculum sp.]
MISPSQFEGENRFLRMSTAGQINLHFRLPWRSDAAVKSLLKGLRHYSKGFSLPGMTLMIAGVVYLLTAGIINQLSDF